MTIEPMSPRMVVIDPTDDMSREQWLSVLTRKSVPWGFARCTSFPAR